MGDFADDMLTGRTCSHCGVMFEKAHGYPVLCNSDWFEASDSDKEIYEKATIPEL